MKKKSNLRLAFYGLGFFMFMSFAGLVLAGCGNNKSNDGGDKAVDDEAFYATQPVKSGLYDADYYDITGTNARKGHFDGRIYFTLSPEQSAFYVFENGNRTKIDYLVNLQKPFEKNDSGVYVTMDKKDEPVTVKADSANLVLGFKRGAEDIKITFNPKARFTGSALDVLEKMAAQKNKNKQ